MLNAGNEIRFCMTHGGKEVVAQAGVRGTCERCGEKLRFFERDVGWSQETTLSYYCTNLMVCCELCNRCGATVLELSCGIGDIEREAFEGMKERRWVTAYERMF